jgi:hypothetical protein
MELGNCDIAGTEDVVGASRRRARQLVHIEIDILEDELYDENDVLLMRFCSNRAAHV